MDKKAHAESSSSQNDKPFIGRIERGVTGNGYKAVAEDGSSFFIPGKLAKQLSLYAGKELTEQEYSVLKERIDYCITRVKAVELLAIREHCTAELRIKLFRKKFSPKAIEQVLTSLTDRGLLNDHRFAELWIHSRLRKNPEGRTMLAAGLARKGVDRTIIRDALDNILDEETLLKALEDAAVKILRRRNMDRDKMMRALIRRGFDYGSVLEIVKKNFD
ncbi:MAG: regulatory protein RecX [Spirochaetales bacterium]|nr:regulatory protein RecX [Spirochaetales bacterium]